MKTKIIVPVIGVIVLGGVLFASSKAGANSFGFGGDGTLAARFAEKLGKSEDEVQAVFDELRAEHQTEMQAKHEERLNELVSNGTISEEQKQLLIEKHAEMQQQRQEERQAFKELTPKERREAMQARREEMRAWAEENGIDVEAWRLGLGEGMREVHGRHGEF